MIIVPKKKCESTKSVRKKKDYFKRILDGWGVKKKIDTLMDWKSLTKKINNRESVGFTRVRRERNSCCVQLELHVCV